jgi:small conductance mechanosensitive channel
MTFHEPFVAQYQALPAIIQQMLLASALLVVGWVAIKLVGLAIKGTMRRAKRLDRTVTEFLVTLYAVGAWLLLGAVVLYIAFGVPATALAGLLAVAGFVLGFAVKDTLGNLAAGVTLLVYRPFRVDDVVSVGDVTGKVTNLGIALTTVKLYDARIATMANGEVLQSTIINHTREPTRMADVDVGIAYDDDIDTAIKAILDALAKDPRVLEDPAPEVRVKALGDNSVNLHVRPWVKTPEVWNAKAEFHAIVKRALDDAGCSIPFPQRDVHIIQANGGSDGNGSSGDGSRRLTARQEDPSANP